MKKSDVAHPKNCECFLRLGLDRPSFVSLLFLRLDAKVFDVGNGDFDTKDRVRLDLEFILGAL